MSIRAGLKIDTFGVNIPEGLNFRNSIALAISNLRAATGEAGRRGGGGGDDPLR